MSTSDESGKDAVSLDAVEAALRPLRRLLGRQAASRTPSPGAFARNLRRLAAPLESLTLEEALQEDLQRVVTALSADAVDVDRAWQAIVRIDEKLGLPVRLRVPKARAVLVLPEDAAPQPASARPDDKGDEEGQGGKGRRRRRRKGGKSKSSESSTEATAEPASAARKSRTKEAPPRVSPPARPKPRTWYQELADTGADESLLSAARQAGWSDVADALLSPPQVVDRRQPVHGAGRDLPQGEVAIGGRVRSAWSVLRPDGSARSFVKIAGAGPQVVQWRHPLGQGVLTPEIGARVVVGASVGADGEVTDGHWMVSHRGEARTLRRAQDPGLDGALSELVGSLVGSAGRIEDPVPAALREGAGLLGLDAVAKGFEERGTDDLRAMSRRRFDQLLSLQLGRSWPRFDPTSAERGIPHTIGHRAVVQLEADGILGPPTPAIAAALEPIKRSLRSVRPMRRLVWGSDRVGLDDLALRTMLLVAEARSEVLAVGPDLPTTLLLHERFAPILKRAGFKVGLLDQGAQGPVAEGLRSGEVQVVFATPSALTPKLAFRRLGLVVAWEQDHLGQTEVVARQSRQPAPDVLTVVRGHVPAAQIARAWPIADLDRLGRQGASPARATRWLDAQREDAYRGLAQDVGEGFVGVVAFPMRRGGADLMGLREVEAFAAQIGQQVFGKGPLGVWHGAMSAAERQASWERVDRGEVAGVVCTMPIEFMPPLRSPTSVLIEHADRMDLARVLGLRGLAGETGRVHLVAGADPEEGPDRALDAMVARASDVEVLAAHPSSMRVSEVVPDGFFPELDASDLDLVIRARWAAHTLLAEDPSLGGPHGPRMVRWARRWWERLAPDEDCPLPEPRAASGGARRRRRRRRR